MLGDETYRLAMSHIAMVSIPAHGHVNPSLELIRQLVARGHRVTYANDPSFDHRPGASRESGAASGTSVPGTDAPGTSAAADAETGADAGIAGGGGTAGEAGPVRDIGAAIRETGAELKPYKSTLPGPDHRWTDDTIDALRIFLDDAIAMLPQLREAYEDDRPDLFLYDIAGAPARLLGERWGIPAVQLSPSMVAWDGYEQDMAPMIDAIRADPRGTDYYRRFREWLIAEGSSITDSITFMGRPRRCLALIPRVMQPNVDRVDERVYTFTGPLPRRSKPWPKPAGKRVLLVSLGSEFTDQPELYRRCIRAYGDLPGWHTVLQVGRYVDLADLGPVPDSIEVHRWVPQAAILREADAFLTHAGMGGSAEGLLTGTPMLVAPQAADQFGNADRLVELGVARRVEEDTDLRTALLDLVGDAEVHARLAAIQAEMAEVDAVSLVEAELDAAGAHGCAAG